jgi:hypothetical protein
MAFSSEFIIVPQENWENDVQNFTELASQFMQFFSGKSTPRTLKQLKYVLKCCLNLTIDSQMVLLKEQCGFVDGLASRRHNHKFEIDVGELNDCKFLTIHELQTQAFSSQRLLTALFFF